MPHVLRIDQAEKYQGPVSGKAGRYAIKKTLHSSLIHLTNVHIESKDYGVEGQLSGATGRTREALLHAPVGSHVGSVLTLSL